MSEVPLERPRVIDGERYKRRRLPPSMFSPSGNTVP